MARVVVEGMPETVGGGGMMLNRRRSKARRRKRKELFVVQMCFAGVLLGVVVGLKTVAQKAGEGHFKGLFPSSLSACFLRKDNVHAEFFHKQEQQAARRKRNIETEHWYVLFP